ncbi:hypothetical protein DV735_g242, partial [Chaetothyriales sp. CBS 134920]
MHTSPLQLALTKPVSERVSSTSAVIPPVGTTKVAGSSSTKKPKAEAKTKPIKLRAACNNCFSAKVRCNGDKTGCARCMEKKLSCVYSESRVGKVVGKRRKRLIEEIPTFDSLPNDDGEERGSSDSIHNIGHNNAIAIGKETLL